MILRQGNKMLATGRVAGEVEYKQTNSGKAFCKFGIKADYNPAEKKGVFVNCVAWSPECDLCGGMAKGENVLVTGRTDTREYNGKNYETLSIDHISRSAPPSDMPRPAGTGFVDITPPEDDGDLPF